MNIVISKKNDPIKQGLMLKEKLQFKNYKKTLISAIIILCIVAIFQFLSGGGTGIIEILPIMITFCFGICGIASFTQDEKAKTDSYIRTLPIDIKEMINYKYTFVKWVTFVGAVIGSILTTILCLLFLKEVPFGGYEVDGIGILIIVAPIKAIESMLIVSIVEAIQIPCIYKFGVEKARMQIFVIMAALSVIITLMIGGILYWLEKWGVDIFMIQGLSYYIYIVLIFVIYNASYKISYKICKKKEF